jgi:autotransporter translocation and assembly factor TamB
VNVLDPDLSFQAQLQADWPGALALKEVVALQGATGDVSMHAPLAIQLVGGLAEQRLQLRGAAAGLGYAVMDISAAARHQKGRLYLDTVRLQASEGDNALVASGEVALSPGLTGFLRIESSGIDLPDLDQAVSGRLAGELAMSGDLSEQGWRFALQDTLVTGDINGLPARLTGSVEVDGDDGFLASNLTGEFNEARFSLLAPEQNGGAADLNLEVADLGRWLEDGDGELQVSASLQSLAGDFSVRGRLSQVGVYGLALQQGEFAGYYRPDLNGAFELSAALVDLSFGETALEELRLQARGDLGRQTITLDLKGDYRGRLAISGESDGPNWTGALAPTTLSTPHGDWRLQKAVSLLGSTDPGIFTVARHCWSSRGTAICPGELQLAERSSGSLRISGDMDFLAGLFPGDIAVQGDLDLDVSAAWGGQQSLELRGYSRSTDVKIIRNFGAGEQATVSWELAEGRFQQQPEGLQFDAEIISDGRPIMVAAMLLPADPENRDLTGNVEFRHLQLATLAPLIPQLSSLEGDLHGRVELSGSVQNPLGTGVIEVQDGRLGLLGNPTQLERLQLRLVLEGGRSRVTGSGLLGGGPVQLEGWLTQVPELRLDLQVKGEEHQILVPPSTEMKVSEELQFVVTPGLLDVRGEVVVHEGVVRHEQLPEGGVAVSDRVVVVDYAGNAIRESGAFDTRLDLWVRLRDRFDIEGQGLRATVGGDLHVVQEPARPMQLFGTLNVVGGELEAYRQRLRIQRGTISFAGPPDNPEFNVRAEREIRRDNVTVGVEVTGTLDSPQMTVYSDPVMEHTEAMSFLIRGRGLDAGAAADGTALALSMGASVVNQSGVLAELDRLPLISGVQFGSEGSADDTAATVSGYIGDRIYISYGIGIYEPITVLTARLYFSARLWLEVVSRLENSVDLYYSFEIR